MDKSADNDDWTQLCLKCGLEARMVGLFGGDSFDPDSHIGPDGSLCDGRPEKDEAHGAEKRS